MLKSMLHAELFVWLKLREDLRASGLVLGYELEGQDPALSQFWG